MSLSISLRRSPKPGAFTAQTLSTPRSLLTTSVASASPSTSSAMMSERAARHVAIASRSGRMSCIDEIFFSLMRMNGVLELGGHLLGVGHEVRREVAAVELHALDDSRLGLHAAAPLRP